MSNMKRKLSCNSNSKTSYHSKKPRLVEIIQHYNPDELIPLDVWYIILKYVGIDAQFWVKRVCKQFYELCQYLCIHYWNMPKSNAIITTFNQFHDLLLAPYEVHWNVETQVKISDCIWRFKTLTELNQIFICVQQVLCNPSIFTNILKNQKRNSCFIHLMFFNIIIDTLNRRKTNLSITNNQSMTNILITVDGQPITKIIDVYKLVLNITKEIRTDCGLILFGIQKSKVFSILNRLNKLERYII